MGLLDDYGRVDKNEKLIKEFNQIGVKERDITAVTNRRVLIYNTGHLKANKEIVSIPINQIVDVSFVKRSAVLGDVYIRTCSREIEIKVRDYNTALEIFKLLNRVIYIVKEEEVLGRWKQE